MVHIPSIKNKALLISTLLIQETTPPSLRNQMFEFGFNLGSINKVHCVCVCVCLKPPPQGTNLIQVHYEVFQTQVS